MKVQDTVVRVFSHRLAKEIKMIIGATSKRVTETKKEKEFRTARETRSI